MVLHLHSEVSLVFHNLPVFICLQPVPADHCEICLVSFKHQHIADAIQYIKENGDIVTHGAVITTTGVATRGELKEAIEKGFDAR
jgi:hypothetical protein